MQGTTMLRPVVSECDLIFAGKQAGRQALTRLPAGKEEDVDDEIFGDDDDLAGDEQVRKDEQRGFNRCWRYQR